MAIVKEIRARGTFAQTSSRKHCLRGTVKEFNFKTANVCILCVCMIAKNLISHNLVLQLILRQRRDIKMRIKLV